MGTSTAEADEEENVVKGDPRAVERAAKAKAKASKMRSMGIASNVMAMATGVSTALFKTRVRSCVTSVTRQAM
jgi:hypothetical protein